MPRRSAQHSQISLQQCLPKLNSICYSQTLNIPYGQSSAKLSVIQVIWDLGHLGQLGHLCHLGHSDHSCHSGHLGHSDHFWIIQIIFGSFRSFQHCTEHTHNWLKSGSSGLLRRQISSLNILSDACAIEDGEAVVLTGSQDKDLNTKVMKYTKTGQAITLPTLNTGRCGHACGRVTKSDGATVRAVDQCRSWHYD